MKQPLYLLLGSNIGNRLQYIHAATLQLNLFFEQNPISASSFYETAAWGLENQASFLNQCLLYHSHKCPLHILQEIKKIEQICGRVAKGKWEAREIDIDILIYGEMVFNADELTIPHPLLHQRSFAMHPLIELSPELVHPVFQKKMSHILAHCEDKLSVSKWQNK